MCVEPLCDQHGIRFPFGIRMSNAAAHRESGGHVRVIQTRDEATRLLNRDGFILVTMYQNCWWIASSHMRHGRYSRNIRMTSSLAVIDLRAPLLTSMS
jgi:hypothetical protein